MKQVLQAFVLDQLPEVQAGNDLCALLRPHLTDALPGDILIITHKVLSKALGLITHQHHFPTPSPEAYHAGSLCHKDPGFMQLVINESRQVYTCQRNIVIAERKDGWICCNAGIDHSNAGGQGRYIHLPQDCDFHAKAIAQTLGMQLGFSLPVIICDTHGRVLRNGTTGVVVGSYGIVPIRNYQGKRDRDGTLLQSTQEAVADELAGLATMLMGQGDEGIPAVIVRGANCPVASVDSIALKRPVENQTYQPIGTPIIKEML